MNEVNIMGAPSEKPSEQLNELDYDLPAGRMLRIQRARGWTVYCEYGQLLLTQEGDSRDFIMNPGDRVFINSHGRVLAEAAGMGREGARLRLLRPVRRELPLGPPVVRLVKPSGANAGAALNCHAERCAGLAPLSYERVFRRLRLSSLQETFSALVFLRSRS